MVSFLQVHDIVSGLDGLYENDALHLCQANDDAPENIIIEYHSSYY